MDPLVQRLIDDPEKTYEIDPSRIEPGENISTNLNDLIDLTQYVFDSILNSGDRFPPQLRSMCHCLYQVLLFI